jgi:hypothetical protein
MRWTLVCVLMLGCWTSSKPSSTSSSSGDPITNGSATAAGSAGEETLPPTPGCKRMRKTFVYNCSGVPPAPGEPNGYPATACDECLSDADCSANAGGSCQQRGDSMCNGPRHAVCLYPDPACGGGICAERVQAPPP